MPRDDGHIPRLRRITPLLGLLGIAALGGCSADEPFNPSFALTLDDSKLALRSMRESPRPLDRPLVVLGGIYDPGIASSSVADHLRRVTTDDDRVLSVSFFGQGTFERCRDRLLERLDQAFPSDDASATVEVDVIGISMGGLVARYAALPNEDGRRRLRIHRLFTISTPHRGAALAGLPTIDRRAIDMRRGSAFLARLDEHLGEGEYPIIPYARLDDAVVGEANAAPTGQDAWWVANIPGSFSHMFAMHDPRILADIARRVRGETPYTSGPAVPPPGTDATAPLRAH